MAAREDFPRSPTCESPTCETRFGYAPVPGACGEGDFVIARLRVSVILAALLMVCSGLLAIGTTPFAQAADEDAAAAGSPAGVDSDVLQRPDRASAMSKAIAQNKRVLVTGETTETDQVFANPDGTWSVESYADPKRVQDDDGTWADIDLTLQPVDGGYGPVAAPADSVFSDGGDKTFVELQGVEGKDLKWQWPQTLPAPTVKDNTLTYKDVVENGDLVVTALPGGFSHSIILHGPPSQAEEPLEIPIPVSLDGANIEEATDGSLAVTAGSTDLVTSPAPLMWDAAENAVGDPENVTPVEAAIEKTDSKTELVLTPDADMLNDPDTSYPVTIDPSYVVYSPGSVWVQSSGSATNAVTSNSELRVGTYDGGTTKARSFLKFNSGAWAGSDVISATLRLRNFSSYTCGGAAISVNRITTAWDGNNVTWTNQPPVTTSNQADTTTTPYGGPTGCSTEGFHYWNVKNIAQLWADNPSAYNFGLRLKAVTETYDGSWRKYRSTYYTGGTEASQPRIDVTYNSPPTASAAAPSVDQSTAATTKIAAVVSDPDGATPWAEFTVKRGTTVVFKGLSTSGSGTTQYVDVTNLPKGQYTVTARAYDGRLFSSNSTPSTTFTVASDVTGVLGDSFATVISTQVASLTLPGATPDAETGEMASSQAFVEIAGLAGVPDDEETGRAAVVSMRTSGWSSAGGVSVVNPDGEQPASPNVGITTSMNPSTAISSTSIVGLSE